MITAPQSHKKAAMKALKGVFLLVGVFLGHILFCLWFVPFGSPVFKACLGVALAASIFWEYMLVTFCSVIAVSIPLLASMRLIWLGKRVCSLLKTAKSLIPKRKPGFQSSIVALEEKTLLCVSIIFSFGCCFFQFLPGSHSPMKFVIGLIVGVMLMHRELTFMLKLWYHIFVVMIIKLFNDV